MRGGPEYGAGVGSGVGAGVGVGVGVPSEGVGVGVAVGVDVGVGVAIGVADVTGVPAEGSVVEPSPLHPVRRIRKAVAAAASKRGVTGPMVAAQATRVQTPGWRWTK